MVAAMALRRCPTCARNFRSDERFCAQDGAELTDAPEADDPRIGRLLAGRYRLQAVLGRGGMGVVYEAEQLPLGRAVAVKLLVAERAGRADAVQRFLREARAVSRLKSPWSVLLLDFGHDDASGEPFLVMELVRGETLRARLLREGALPVPIVVQCLRQVGRALAEAHALGVVHRDLRADNIALEGEVDDPIKVKVLDFGVARLIDDDAPLTETSHVPGTPQYIAPERVSGEPLGPASDIYALGIIAYELLTGQAPYRGTTWEVMHAHVTARPRPFAEVAPERHVPEPLAALVWRMLARSPELRPADGAAFVAALDAVAPESSRAPPIPLDIVPTRSPRRPVGMALAALVVLLALAAWLGWSARTAEVAWLPGPVVPVPIAIAPAEAPVTPASSPALLVPPVTVAAPTPEAAPPSVALEPAAPEPGPRPRPITRAPAAPPSASPGAAPAASPTSDPTSERVDKLLP